MLMSEEEHTNMDCGDRWREDRPQVHSTTADTLISDWVEETDFGPILFTNFGGSFPLQNNCRPRQWAHGSSTALYTDSWTCVMWLRLGPLESLTLYRAPCKI